MVKYLFKVGINIIKLIEYFGGLSLSSHGRIKVTYWSLLLWLNCMQSLSLAPFG